MMRIVHVHKYRNWVNFRVRTWIIPTITARGLDHTYNHHSNGASISAILASKFKPELAFQSIIEFTGRGLWDNPTELYYNSWRTCSRPLSYIIIPGGLAPPISVTLAAMFLKQKTWRILAFADARMTPLGSFCSWHIPLIRLNSEPTTANAPLVFRNKRIPPWFI